MKQIGIIFLAVCSLFASIKVSGQEIKKVLFIGNSYTYVNDLPNTLKDVAANEGRELKVSNITQGGARFQTHCSNETTLNAIASGNYDIMIIQGQSQEVAFPYNQFYNEVYPYAKQLDSLFKANNPDGRVIYYMTWGYRYGDQINCQFYSPFCSYWTMSEELCDNYTTFAEDFDSEVAPCGKAWQLSIGIDSTIVLHSSDNSHPTEQGTLLNAYVMYNTIFNDTLVHASDSYLKFIANYTTTHNNLGCNLENYNINSSIENVEESSFNVVFLQDNSIMQVDSKAEGEYIVYNLNGKEECRGKIVSGQQNINLKCLKLGSYIFYIRSDKGSRSDKFIKL
ncbi:MAG: T9SS type A sorting domain-containing protein [Bacteroidales bacterium]|nr:T9SS type A sorting domain-containing protein [Bacteroidales bacterium]